MFQQKGNKQSILFIDPKGDRNTDYEHKIDGYKKVFENQIFKVFQFHTLNKKLTPLGKEKEKVTKI